MIPSTIPPLSTASGGADILVEGVAAAGMLSTLVMIPIDRSLQLRRLQPRSPGHID